MSKISVTTIAGLTSGGDANTVKIESGDDFVVDTNVLKVDASNNRVGIGTASPSQTLETAGNIFINTTGNPNLTVKTSGSGNNPNIRIQADTNYWDLQTLFSNTNDELDFRYNGNSKMMIDKEGRVTKSAQPSFRAGMTANQTVAQNAVVTYQSTDHNIGNHFDTSSNVGRFTCPVAGRYLFGIAMGDGNNSGISGIFALCKNGSRHYDFLEGGAPSGISGHYEKHASVVVNASANDYFDIRQISSGNKSLEGTADGLSTRNRFWGHLLG